MEAVKGRSVTDRSISRTTNRIRVVPALIPYADRN